MNEYITYQCGPHVKILKATLLPLGLICIKTTIKEGKALPSNYLTVAFGHKKAGNLVK